MSHRLEFVVDDQLGDELGETKPVEKKKNDQLSSPMGAGSRSNLHVYSLGEGGDSERVPSLINTGHEPRSDQPRSHQTVSGSFAKLTDFALP